MASSTPSAPTNRPTRVAIVAGATGLVGREIVAALLADPGVAAVHVLARRPATGTGAPKLHWHQVDFLALPALPRADEVYLALGTTIKVAGSQQAFRAVDFDANLAVAQAARAAGASRAGLVSAMGASAASRVFYNRVKGELEEALGALAFGGLVIARPSLLMGDRSSLGQPVRGGEQIGQRIDRWVGWLIPRNLRAIAAADVAHALVTRVPTARGRLVLPSGAMQHRLGSAD